MTKLMKTLMIVALVAIALGAVGVAYAQSNLPQPGTGTGYGMMGGRGRMAATDRGLYQDILHDYMVTAWAEQLGLSVEDVQSRLDQGETMSQIALAQGKTFEEFRTLMVTVRSQAIEQALADGKITQEQADWMKQRGAGMMGGQGVSGRGARGTGQGRYANPGCPYSNQVTP